MEFGWDTGKEVAKKVGKGMFVRLQNDGDTFTGVPIGEPLIQVQHWLGEKENKYATCVGDKCPHCHAGNRPNMGFMVNALEVKTGAMKVLQGGAKLFRAILVAKDKYGLNKVFEFKRTGKARDAQTTFNVLYEREIDDALRARIDAAKPYDMERLAKEEEQGGAPAPNKPAPAANQAPPVPGLIDPSSAQEIIGQLKAMPKEAVESFLKTFGIQRVRELRAEDEEAARTFIGNMMNGASNDADPFAA